MSHWHALGLYPKSVTLRTHECRAVNANFVHNGRQKRSYVHHLGSKFCQLEGSELKSFPDDRVSTSGRSSTLVVVSQPSKEAALWPWRNRWRYLRSQRSGLPRVDWRRYNLQVLFVDRTDTVRARIAAGLFERVAEWNGYGRALYPATSGVAANPNIDMSTTVALMVQAQLLGMRPQVFARRAEQFEYDDFDRFDLIVAVDRSVMDDIFVFAGPTRAEKDWYAPRVCLLSDFAGYPTPSSLLARGGSALLEPALSAMLAPVLRPGVPAAKDIPQVKLNEGVEGNVWNQMVLSILLPCAGLVQYLADAVPPDLAHWDPE